jgi:uncharacterized YigZ family protein
VRTVRQAASLELGIRRSRFIAHAARVDTLHDTLTFYEQVADPQATHNCWAWRLDQQYRCNDDGEPGGTAGKPILSAIDGRDLFHTMVVVTRYFGGVKLGIGGLVRAYGGSASKCLDQAGSCRLETAVTCAIRGDFQWTGPVYSALESCGAEKRSERFESGGMLIHAVVAEGSVEALLRLLRDTTRGEVSVRVLERSARARPGRHPENLNATPGSDSA